MFIVGLTGGIATGKSTVLAIFREKGVAVIDADDVAREVMEKGTSVWHQIGRVFGEEIYCSDGAINRQMLAEIVFNNEEKRRTLNRITHPQIQRAIIKMSIKYFFRGHPYIVMELPLLFETGIMYNFMHKIITVTCQDSQQLERLCNRNSMPSNAAVLRINSQMPLAEKVAKSDFVIDNSGNIAETKKQTEIIIAKLNECKVYWYVKNTVKIVIITMLTAYVVKTALKKYLWI